MFDVTTIAVLVTLALFLLDATIERFVIPVARASHEWTPDYTKHDLGDVVERMRAKIFFTREPCVPAASIGVPLRVIALSNGTAYVNPRVEWSSPTHHNVEFVERDGTRSHKEVADRIRVTYLGEYLGRERAGEMVGTNAECFQLAMDEFERGVEAGEAREVVATTRGGEPWDEWLIRVTSSLI